LTNGRTVNVSLAKIPEPIDLTHAKWHVAVEDWKPANPYDSTRGEKASETTKNKLDLDLDELKPWPSIPQLQHVSGIGTYRTEFDLPTDWKPGTGAMLRLGEVFDSFALTINGVQVPVDQLSAETDAGPYLKAGKNTIVVRVATTLNNRLSELEPLVKKRGIVQQYGLIGPVVLTPYHLIPLSSHAE